MRNAVSYDLVLLLKVPGSLDYHCRVINDALNMRKWLLKLMALLLSSMQIFMLVTQSIVLCDKMHE